MNSSHVHNCKLLQLPKIHNRAGNITVIENDSIIPFPVKRIYYLYDVPGGAERAAHGHKNLQQLIVAASGSFDITIDDGKEKKRIHLNMPYEGLLIRPGIWRDLDNFSSGSICLVLASEIYDEKDYIRNYNDFLIWKKENNN
jgi:hypothetical protein